MGRRPGRGGHDKALTFGFALAAVNPKNLLLVIGAKLIGHGIAGLSA